MREYEYQIVDIEDHHDAKVGRLVHRGEHAEYAFGAVGLVHMKPGHLPTVMWYGRDYEQVGRRLAFHDWTVRNCAGHWIEPMISAFEDCTPLGISMILDRPPSRLIIDEVDVYREPDGFQSVRVEVRMMDGTRLDAHLLDRDDARIAHPHELDCYADPAVKGATSFHLFYEGEWRHMSLTI